MCEYRSTEPADASDAVWAWAAQPETKATVDVSTRSAVLATGGENPLRFLLEFIGRHTLARSRYLAWIIANIN